MKIFISVKNHCYGFTLDNKQEITNIIGKILSGDKHVIEKEPASIEYNNVIVPCPKCAGTGKTDWVKKIVNTSTNLGFPYNVKFHTKGKYLISHNKKVIYIYALCSLTKKLGEYYCNDCLGTGLTNMRIAMTMYKGQDKLNQIVCKKNELEEIIASILKDF